MSEKQKAAIASYKSDKALTPNQAKGQETMAKSNTPTVASNQAILDEINRLREENAKLKASQANNRGISCKVSEKGALSVYGLGRFPVTLYGGQWDNLFANIDMIKAYREENASRLATKE